jgi:hypothetical protein
MNRSCSYHQQDKKRKLCKRRAAIEPIIGHLKSDFGGSNAPTDSGYTKIYSTGYAFAALKADEVE